MKASPSSNDHVPVLVRLARLYQRSSLRGRTRLTVIMARRLKALQSVRVPFPDRPPVYVDLRVSSTHGFFKDAAETVASWEADEQEMMRRLVRPGDTVFDIGANIGVHTALLSRLVGAGGRVVAFEPNPQLIATLQRTINGLPNTSLHAVALSDASSTCTLFVTEGDSTLTSLADWTRGEIAGATKRVTAPQRRMDDLIRDEGLPTPDFIKCDVEGAELKVFSGGRATLDRAEAPVILFEANDCTARGFGLTMTAARDFLAGLTAARYRFFDIDGGSLTPLCESSAVHTNVVAVPQAKCAAFAGVFRTSVASNALAES